MLPFLVAAMAFLAALALGGAIGATALARHWRVGPAAVLTVQVPRPGAAAAGAPGSRRDRVIALLRATPGIALVRPLPDEELTELLRPWLGGRTEEISLPLPGVIEIRLAEGGAVPGGLPAGLARRLGEAAPGTLVEGHGPWLRRLSVLARSLQASALVALLLVVAVAAAVVAVATRAGLAARREAIEIVHGLGATDGYIAGRFAARIMRLAALGGFSGAVVALPVLAGLAWLAAPFIRPEATGSDMDLAHGMDVLAALPAPFWWLLPGLPAAAVIIGWLTAQATVRRWLRQLP
jgi:cell division transport system permease protein